MGKVEPNQWLNYDLLTASWKSRSRTNGLPTISSPLPQPQKRYSDISTIYLTILTNNPGVKKNLSWNVHSIISEEMGGGYSRLRLFIVCGVGVFLEKAMPNFSRLAGNKKCQSLLRRTRDVTFVWSVFTKHYLSWSKNNGLQVTIIVCFKPCCLKNLSVYLSGMLWLKWNLIITPFLPPVKFCCRKFWEKQRGFLLWFIVSSGLARK